MLGDWRFSPFEHEAALRSGLRSGLCIRGHEWGRADHEAASIVGEAERRAGVRRPDWNEGQWIYTVGPDHCVWCHSPIDDEDRTRGQRFCSSLCAKMALEHRDYETRKAADAIGQSAQILTARKKRPAVACRCCGKEFHPRKRGAVYCSAGCIRSARGDLLADRNCLACGEVFHPRDASERCCSKSCATRYAVQQRREAAEPQNCGHCQSLFRPSRKTQLYCSSYCSSTVAKAAHRARQWLAEAIEPEAPVACDWCGKPFTGKRGRTCSSNCSVYLSNARAGKFPRRMTPPVFDFLVRMAA